MDASRVALLDEAMKKSGLVWITVPGRRPAPAWYVWRGGPDPAAYVLTEGGEQLIPGLTDTARHPSHPDLGADPKDAGDAGEVTVSARSKDTGALLIGWTARAAVVPADSQEWAEILPDLQAKRLNPPDGLDAPTRWARDSHLIRLTPTGPITAGPAADHPTP